MTSTDDFTSYDEAPYPSSAVPPSHPNRVAGMARLFGLDPVAPSTARVLELGCADGANLLPMADRAPRASFLGIDASKVQVTSGRRAIEKAGLKNVELRVQNILEFPGGEGRFDFIIAHGIYSWVPEPVRDKILAICQQHLAEKGLAFVSYNALPGWNMRRSLREMMLFHTRAIENPIERVQSARALLNFLVQWVPADNNAYGMLLRSEAKLLQSKEDNYLRHEFLEDENTAFYLHEFTTAAARYGLQYLGEPDVAQMFAGNFPERVQMKLTEASGDAIAQEQYMDFLRNRQFRQAILCRRSVVLSRHLVSGRIPSLAFESSLEPGNTPVDLRPGLEVRFPAQSGRQIATRDPLLKAALQVLRRNLPSVVSYQEVAAGVAASTKSADAEASELPLASHTALQNLLLNLVARGVLNVMAEPVACATSVPDLPFLSPLMRYQAGHARAITSRLHIPAAGDDLTRAIMELCDGTRSRVDIVAALKARIAQGELQIARSADRPIAPVELDALLTRRVSVMLAALVSKGFFAASES